MLASESPTSSFEDHTDLCILSCSDLIDFDFNGRLRLIYFRKVSGSSLISIPSTMISPTLTGGRSLKKLYPNSCPGYSMGSSTSGSISMSLLSVSTECSWCLGCIQIWGCRFLVLLPNCWSWHSLCSCWGTSSAVGGHFWWVHQHWWGRSWVF